MRWDALGASIAAVGLLLASGGASAQAPPSETKFYVQTRSGVPAMCGIEFWHPYRDHIYAGGAATVATGSLEWLRSGRAIFMSIKVLGAEVPTNSAPEAASNLFKIHNAFVTAGKRHYFVRGKEQVAMIDAPSR